MAQEVETSDVITDSSDTIAENFIFLVRCIYSVVFLDDAYPLGTSSRAGRRSGVFKIIRYALHKGV